MCKSILPSMSTILSSVLSHQIALQIMSTVKSHRKKKHWGYSSTSKLSIWARSITSIHTLWSLCGCGREEHPAQNRSNGVRFPNSNCLPTDPLWLCCERHVLVHCCFPFLSAPKLPFFIVQGDFSLCWSPAAWMSMVRFEFLVIRKLECDGWL